MSSASYEFAERMAGPFILDQKVWARHVDLEAYGLSFEGLFIPDEGKQSQAIKRLARRVDNNEMSVITMPKGISISKLLQIAKEKEVPVYSVWPQMKLEIGDVELEQAYVGLVSDSVLTNTRRLSIEDRDAYVQTRAYEMPPVTVLLTNIIFQYIVSSRCLFGTSTFSLTSDCINDGTRVVIGGFDKDGFIIDDSPNCPDQNEGAAVLHRFLE